MSIAPGKEAATVRAPRADGTIPTPTPTPPSTRGPRLPVLTPLLHWVRNAPAAPWLAGAIGLAVAVAGITVSRNNFPAHGGVWLLIQLAGVSFTITGVLLWLRRGSNPTGRLMVLVGVIWYIGDLQSVDHPVLFALGFCFYYQAPVAVAHLVLALPTGRLPGPAERWLITAMYVLAPVVSFLRYLDELPDPVPQPGAAPGGDHSVWADVGSLINIVLISTALVLAVRRWVLAGRSARREYSLVWGTASVMALTSSSFSAAFLLRAPGWEYLLLAYSAGLILMPVGIAIGLLRVRLTRLRVAQLVIRLADTVQPAELRDALAQALDDPDLTLCFPLPDGTGYVDVDGHPVADPASGGRATAPIGPTAGRLAVLVHGPNAHPDPALVDAVVAAARLTLENASLHALARAQLEEVRRSRARIVVAADQERHRVQRDLHDGVQHNLLAVSMLLERAAESLGEQPPAVGRRLIGRAGDELRDAIRELRNLTEGIFPPALAEQGLASAVESLAERAPLPVTAEVPARRWPENLERTAYFVVREALANVYKHSGAGQATVRVSGGDDLLTVEVVDDGRGGADARRGSGLRGLTDRVGAHNGSLWVDSPPTGGTRVRAVLPCG